MQDDFTLPGEVDAIYFQHLADWKYAFFSRCHCLLMPPLRETLDAPGNGVWCNVFPGLAGTVLASFRLCALCCAGAAPVWPADSQRTAVSIWWKRSNKCVTQWRCANISCSSITEHAASDARFCRLLNFPKLPFWIAFKDINQFSFAPFVSVKQRGSMWLFTALQRPIRGGTMWNWCINNEGL